MYKNENELPGSQDLQTENELAQMKLELERGATFYRNPEMQMPPEIENQWLKNIQQFEEMHEQCRQTTVYGFCGSPAFRKFEEVAAEDLPVALAGLLNTFEERNISLSSICSVEDAVMYRFITEEFFSHEIDDMHVEGMMHCFTYEDFHPNNEYDIIKACEEFVAGIIRKKFPESNMMMWMEHNFHTAEGLVSDEEAFEKLRAAHQKFRSLKLETFENISVDVGEETATAVFRIIFSGEEDSCPFHYEGKATIRACADVRVLDQQDRSLGI